MRVFQIIRTTKMIMEDLNIGFEKIWLYAKHDAGECACGECVCGECAWYPGKNNRCS